MTEDDTIRIPPRRRWTRAAGLIGAITVAGLAILLWHGRNPPVVPHAPPPPSASRAPAPPVVEGPPLATEADILARAPTEPEAYRFAPQPDIVIVQFPDLGTQAAALNRAAALVEKAGFPRDRVLEDAELERRIRGLGEDPARFYYGHDYRIADLHRFFTLARQQHVALTPEEQSLERQLQTWQAGAILTLVRQNEVLDRQARAVILRHELSHGLYFTNAAYAAYAQAFWDHTLAPSEQAGFRRFLAADGYDILQADLVTNEMQAYLMHTTDERFFNADAVGIAPARLAQLRGLFLVGMPPGWLRDCTPSPTTAPVSSRP